MQKNNKKFNVYLLSIHIYIPVLLYQTFPLHSCLLRYGTSVAQQSANSVRINRSGDQILALRRRLPPILYNIHSNKPLCEFDHTGYFNSCTMKSCCFAGDRDQVFHFEFIYMYFYTGKIATCEIHMKLISHVVLYVFHMKLSSCAKNTGM